MAQIPVAVEVTPEMTPQQMRAYYLEQTRRSMTEWEARNWSFEDSPPFRLEDPGPLEVRLTPELARKIDLRAQVEAFAAEAQVSTAGVRENQNVLCPWDHRYRINEYILALMSESLSRLVKELHQERVAGLPQISPEEVATRLGPVGVETIEEIFGMDLAEAMRFARQNPIRIVGGEVRSNTPRFVDLTSRIYAAQGLHVFLTEDPSCQDTSTIFLWSFLTYMLGLSGGDYYTSSHGAPQKQSDKILGPDGSQYLPPEYARIVAHMRDILHQVETTGYTLRLAARDDAHLHRSLTYPRMGRLYADYLRKGPASEEALALIGRAIDQGMRLKLDFFGGAGYRTLEPVLKELGILKAFEGGFLRTEEDPFFHNIGFRVARKKTGEGYEVVHDSVDASLPQVVRSAGYDVLLRDAPLGQTLFNVDPDSDRFVVGQVVPASEAGNLERLGVTSLPLGAERRFAIYSPNQFFLMLAENDRVQMVGEGTWGEHSSFDVHTYVSALSWDEWAEFHGIPVVRTPVGFKEIAAVQRQVEAAMQRQPGQPIEVQDELGNRIRIGSRPKVHHAGEESGGKIGGPREPIPNLLGQSVIAMREKSSGEACISAVALMARLYLESREPGCQARIYLHHNLDRLFQESRIAHPMEFRGDKVHYNEAIFDPEELARAKAAGIEEKDRFNNYFRTLARAMSDPSLTRSGRPLTLQEVREILTEAMPGMREDWARLERVDVWSDGLQLWFAPGGCVRDICLRPSGTDAKSKVYFDGTDKAGLEELFNQHFRNFEAQPGPRYLELVGS